MSTRHVIVLTEEERNIIFGTLLGDGSVSLSGTGKSARVSINQSMAQKELVEWKYAKLRRLVGTPPKERANGGFGGSLCRFSTLSSLALKEIYDIVHVGGKKTVTTQWLAGITHPIALAVWYMDDGSQQRSTMNIHTEGFSQVENEILAGWMKSVWGVECHPYSVGKYWRLMFPAEGRDRFQELVGRYVVPELQYKIIPKLEMVFCTMCGKSFQVGRRQIYENRRIILCGSDDCSKKWKRMYGRIAMYCRHVVT
jgi:recombination protein RecA